MSALQSSPFSTPCARENNPDSEENSPASDRMRGLDCRQSSESFRPPFGGGGAVEGAEPSSPPADGEILSFRRFFLPLCAAKCAFLFTPTWSKKKRRSFLHFIYEDVFCQQSEPRIQPDAGLFCDPEYEYKKIPILFLKSLLTIKRLCDIIMV